MCCISIVGLIDCRPCREAGHAEAQGAVFRQQHLPNRAQEISLMADVTISVVLL